jgi:hypothetical protein
MAEDLYEILAIEAQENCARGYIGLEVFCSYNQEQL